ncbi:MAG: ABC transporter transmembrane domain-containing protein [Pseudomonadota bacterium]|nr:ABC transporter transmembrane domain-containing protein [Pseudomonadota bacterium]
MTAAIGGRAKRRDVRPLAHLAPFLRAHWGDAAWSVAFLLVSTSATLGLSGAARLVVDRGFSSAGASQLNRAFLFLIAVAAVLAVATALRFYFISKLGERVVADLRAALYRHVLTLDQAYFLKVRTGEVLSRLTTDMTIVESMVGSSASVALRNLLTLVGALAVLVFVSPRLTLYVALLAPAILAPLLLFGRRVRKLSIHAQERFADAVGYAGETLDALDTLQAFGREKSAGERFGRSVETAFGASLARIRARALMTGLVITLVFGGVATIFWLGAHAVVIGTMTGGTLLMFAILAVLAAGSVGALGEVWGDVQKAAGAMDRIAELLGATPAIAVPPAPLPMPRPARGEIAFEQVVFAYPGRADLPALNGFDLRVGAGERVALVGPSGAGKSTVFRLALRFYDPQGGVVRIDGVDVKTADPAEVRALIALVAQDAPLFSGSALENLRFGREDATPDELIAAARAAEAEAFIAALPRGFDTPLGERGKTLSGGERQRLAIARALTRDAPILLLDEATSALDAENERLVQPALHDAMSGRTTLVIAHRLATVLAADRIVVMDAGRVVESGTHAELSARGGLYARLAQLQFGMEAA